MKRPSRPDIAAAEAAARVGAELREARLALGLPIEAVAERLRIRRAYLHALEEGRLKDLPGAAYAIGFVRSYGRALGLDDEELVRRFRDLGGAAAAGGRGPDLVFPEPVPERGVPAGLVMLAGAVVVIGAYAAWYNWSGPGERSVDAVPPLPARLERMAEGGGGGTPGAPAAAAIAAAAGAPGTAGNAGGAAGTGGTPPPPPSPPHAAAPPTQALAATMTPGAVPPAPPPPPPAAAEEGPVVAAAANVVTPATPPASRILLRARAQTNVTVRDPRGAGGAAAPPLLNRILRAGETYEVPPREGLVLSVGRADALELVVDGEPAPALNGLRGRRDNIALDAERLKAGPLAPPPRPAAGRPARSAAAPPQAAPEVPAPR